MPQTSSDGLATTKTTGIKTLADIKGKRIAWVVGSSGNQRLVTSTLAFVGLTIDDIELIEVRSIADAYDALLTGVADVSPLDTGAPTAYEIASAPGGIQWLSYPPEDTEGWAAFREINPRETAKFTTEGAGVPPEGVWLPNHPYPRFFAYDWSDEGDVYWMVKMMAESYDLYKNVMAGMELFNLESAITALTSLPYHSGAIRYFKEKGVWTAQLEKNQQELLDHQVELKALWDETMTEAIDRMNRTEERPRDFWVDLWMQKRADAGVTYWYETKIQ